MIYYVEDDRNIRELVVYSLRQSGYEAKGFVDGNGFFRALRGARPDLVLLDIMLPNESGLDILRRLKMGESTAALPVIIMTAKGDELDKVAGLELGADDYIAKPFGIMEMLSRVKALLRRANIGNMAASTVQAHGLVLHPDSFMAECEDRRLDLTLKEFELLLFLARNENAAFRREQLLQQVWGEGYRGGTRTVDVHIQTLRGKLGGKAELIQTIRGLGYRFGSNGDV